MKAIVFGEVALDILIKRSFLAPESTIIRGSSYAATSGGHGANQAIALSHLGVNTYLISRVGNDLFQQEILSNLIKANVNVDGVFRGEGNSGLAILAIEETRDFRVLAFIEGVNKYISQEDVTRFISLMEGANVALSYLGFPITIVQAALRAAKSAGILTILDPTPTLPDVPIELYTLSDILTPNQLEAEYLVGFPVRDVESARAAAALLRQRGSSTVIIKMGAQGVFCAAPDRAFFAPAFAINVVDTVGAGDAFNGGLAAGLAYKLPLEQAVIWGSGTAALSLMGEGAQSTLPTISSLQNLIRAQPISLFFQE
jgi:ribokinase